MIEGVTILGVATAGAALIGPALAVWITRMSDDRKEVRARRMDIFRTLMRTRKMPIHFDHVGALNLIEIEFAKDADVIAAWKNYLKNLSERLPADANKDDEIAFSKARENLLTKLIYEISKVLKFKVEQLDILEGNYIPQGWNDDDWEQKIVRKALIDVLGGRRPLLIQPHTPSQKNGPYPAAPEVPRSGD
ncbi:DUF6680 family protein [Roseovarius sp.]|uniref:DUF6680 family protein n=1 Tax=Roseovarius sp. TaxID=1486281 RepID=UPI00257973AF|nr:DUF6680 family protein [Roseovarius sp.]|tara:strand:- start:332 stop:904 length:573 start_codon:yes stop_codon:yes gene_type:complete